MSVSIEHKRIGTKDVYIFECHHHALIPWAEARVKCEKALGLVTFDFHTDTHTPFLFHTWDEEYTKKLTESVEYDNPQTIHEAIDLLKNDEHICTAIDKDIISCAFIICSDSEVEEEPKPIQVKQRQDLIRKLSFDSYDPDKVNLLFQKQIVRPYTYPKPERNIFITPKESCYNNFPINGNEIFIEDILLEDSFIEDKLKVLKDMCPDSFSNLLPKFKYILDFDLDYFLTPKSVQPTNRFYISELIQNAELITIAKESTCVEFCSQENGIATSSEYLLPELLKLITECLS